MAGGNKGKRKLEGNTSSCVSNDKGSSSGVPELKEMEIYIASKETPHIPERGVKVVFNESGAEISTWTSQEGEKSNISCHQDNTWLEKIPVLKEMVINIASEETPHIPEISIKVEVLEESSGGHDSTFVNSHQEKEKEIKNSNNDELNWEELEPFTNFDPNVKSMVDSFGRQIDTDESKKSADQGYITPK